MAIDGEELETTTVDPGVDGPDASALEEETTGDERRSQFARRYPPLLSMLAGLIIAIFVLPSALNLPQTNPTQTLEYAPVPPDDSKDPPPPQGNLSNLGLGQSNGIEGGGAQGGSGGGPGTLPPSLGDGIGGNPQQFRCVGNPPRQTEDPLAPPCVAYFKGDNFGETYQGVTKDEIRLLLYFDGGIGTLGTSRGQETCPTLTLIDLVNDAPQQNECHQVRAARIWQKYFNLRYQTYGRFGHFFLYFGTNNNSTTPETRRADAAEAYRRVVPFATIDYSSFSGGGSSFVDSMAKRGSLNFGSFVGQDNTFFRRYPKLIWGYQPALEVMANNYGTVLCNMYVGRKVTHSGGYQGQDRRFGLVYTTDPGFDTLRRLKDNVMKKFGACGGTLATNPGTFPTAGYSADTVNGSSYATEVMQRFQAAHVTTIIWPGGMEPNFTKAAKNLQYFPEWIVIGDGDMDNEFAQQGYNGSHGQDRDVWSHAVVVSPQPEEPMRAEDAICFQAQRSIDPNVPRQDAAATGCDQYNQLRQLFIGIQVAGPRLGPTSIDRGFHAIPAIPSTNMQVPACYYLPGDYTCIKDFIIGKWDPQGYTNSGTAAAAEYPGCYRQSGNRRLRVEDLPKADPLYAFQPNDPCQHYGSGLRQNLGPPNPNTL